MQRVITQRGVYCLYLGKIHMYFVRQDVHSENEAWLRLHAGKIHFITDHMDPMIQ